MSTQFVVKDSTVLLPRFDKHVADLARMHEDRLSELAKYEEGLAAYTARPWYRKWLGYNSGGWELCRLTASTERSRGRLLEAETMRDVFAQQHEVLLDESLKHFLP